jgi:penicillin-binding protein 1C
VRFPPAIEPPRDEWFLTGTEATTVVLSEPRHRPPRIVSPPNGVVIALDPDIPAANQAVVFSARSPRENTSFVLDDRALAPATARYKWQPRPGHHRLALVGTDGKTYDSVDFMVRRVR